MMSFLLPLNVATSFFALTPAFRIFLSPDLHSQTPPVPAGSSPCGICPDRLFPSVQPPSARRNHCLSRFQSLRSPGAGQGTIPEPTVFEGTRLASFPWSVNSAKGKPVLIRCSFQRQVGHGFDSGFVHRHFPGIPLGREAEAKPFVAACYLRLERLFAVGIGSPQESVPGSFLFVPSDKHGVAVTSAFIEHPGPDAGIDHFPADPAPDKIREYSFLVFCCRRQNEFLSCFGWEESGKYAGLSPHRDRTASTNFIPST